MKPTLPTINGSLFAPLGSIKRLCVCFVLFVSLAPALLAQGYSNRRPATKKNVVVEVFKDNVLHHGGKRLAALVNQPPKPAVVMLDSGQGVGREVMIPKIPFKARIIAEVHIKPAPHHKHKGRVEDPWDRAAYVLLKTPGKEVELMRFMTGFGGEATHRIDVTHLAPFLQGKCDFKALVGNWNQHPAWIISFRLHFIPDASVIPSDWARSVFPEQTIWAKKFSKGETLKASVDIPKGGQQVRLYYLVSGHSHDEFRTKSHVFSINGKEVARFKPWRDDCHLFLDKNPYTGKWVNPRGTITRSSDLPRSGWCPGDMVYPKQWVLTQHLPEGRHDIELKIEYPKPQEKGKWLVSAYLVGGPLGFEGSNAKLKLKPESKAPSQNSR